MLSSTLLWNNPNIMSVLDGLMRTFRDLDDAETGDVELNFMARECAAVAPRYAEVIIRQGKPSDDNSRQKIADRPRSVLAPVYEFCKENLNVREVVLREQLSSPYVTSTKFK